jgi:hypothetical protein
MLSQMGITLALGNGSSLLPLYAGGTGIEQQQRTKSGTYTITVSGSSSNIQHTLPLTLTIQ